MPILAALGGLAVGLAVGLEKIHLPDGIMAGLRSLAERIPSPDIIKEEATRLQLVNAETAVIAGLIAFIFVWLFLEPFRFRLLVWKGRFRQRLAEKTLQKPAVANEYSGTTEALKKLYN